MKFRLWVHAKDNDGNTLQQGVVETGYFGNKRTAIDGLHPIAMRLIKHTQIGEVSYRIFKETSLKPVSSGVLHAVTVKDKEKSEEKNG